MKQKRISELPIYTGDTTGTWLVINSPNQSGTFKIQKEEYLNDENGGGTSGTSGIDGTSGTSGIDGTSGTSGIDGTNGTGGTSGIDGTSGTSGIDGTNGTGGTSGIDGTSGTSGIDGTNGTGGTSGIDGTSGTSGIDGTSGTSGIEGTNYVFIQANGTPTENAVELQAAYGLAKTMSPSASNRITVIAAAGEYQFTSTFVMDTEYIDLVSLTGNRDVIFDLQGITDPFSFDSNTNEITDISECLLIDVNNVFVKGIKCRFYLSPNFDSFYGQGGDYILPIQVGDNLPNIIIENCEGGIFSFGGDITYGSNPITVSGTFTNCQGGMGSFGGYGTASGTFTNCVGGDSSFGSGGSATLSGKLYYCRLTSGTFQTVSSGGRTYYCIDGNGDPDNQ